MAGSVARGSAPVDLSEFDIAPLKGPPCTVSIALEALDDEHREKVEAAMLYGKTGRAIALRLTEWSGVAVRAHTINRHRAGECRCGS